MAFSPALTRTPIAIGSVEVCLYSPDPNGIEQSSASFAVEVRYSDASVQVLTGDLVPHLTQQQINALIAFMDTLRVQAQNQILP